MNVRLVSYTTPCEDLKLQGIHTAEDIIVHNARVSNPNNQLNTSTGDKLIKYCVDHGHWSIFEQAFMTVEIKTSRAIAQQIVRHRSFTFQEFSQRYSTVYEMEPIEMRKQAEHNRQSSTEVVEDATCAQLISMLNTVASKTYDELLKKGVARECARMVLPLATQTTLYMSGSCRSFVHYIDLRTKEDTQKEHRDVALAVKNIFSKVFHRTSNALGYVS
jgi:thymidylate synthase (FAD)